MKKSGNKHNLVRLIAMLLAVIFLVQNDGVTALAASASAGQEDELQASSLMSGEAGTPENPIPLKVNTDRSANLSLEGLWYSYTPSVSGNYTLYSKGDEDTIVYLYSVPDTNERALADADYGGEHNNFSLEYFLEAGKTYYYNARMYYDTSGDVEICFESDAVTHDYSPVIEDVPTDAPYVPTEEPASSPAPTNAPDTPEAEMLTPGSQIPVTITEQEAVKWFSFTPTETGTYIINSEGDIDTKVEMYLGTFDSPVATNNDGGHDQNFFMKNKLEADKTYYYKISADTAGEAFNLNFNKLDTELTIESIELNTGLRVHDYYMVSPKDVALDGISLSVRYNNGTGEVIYNDCPSIYTGDRMTITPDTLYDSDNKLIGGKHTILAGYRDKSVEDEITVHTGVPEATELTFDKTKVFYLGDKDKWFKFTPEESGYYNVLSTTEKGYSDDITVYSGDNIQYENQDITREIKRNGKDYCEQSNYVYFTKNNIVYIKDHSSYSSHLVSLKISRCDTSLTTELSYNQECDTNNDSYIVADIPRAGSYELVNIREYSDENMPDYFGSISIRNNLDIRNTSSSDYTVSSEPVQESPGQYSYKYNLDFNKSGLYLIVINGAMTATTSEYTLTSLSGSNMLACDTDYTGTATNEANKYSFTAPKAGCYCFDVYSDYMINTRLSGEINGNYDVALDDNAHTSSRHSKLVYLEKDETRTLEVAGQGSLTEVSYRIRVSRGDSLGAGQNTYETDKSMHSFSVDKSGMYIFNSHRVITDKNADEDGYCIKGSIFAQTSDSNQIYYYCGLDEVHVISDETSEDTVYTRELTTRTCAYLEKDKTYYYHDNGIGDYTSYTLELEKANTITVGSEVQLPEDSSSDLSEFVPSESGYYAIEIKGDSVSQCTLRYSDFGKIDGNGTTGRKIYYLNQDQLYLLHTTDYKNASLTITKLPDITGIEITSLPEKTEYTCGFDDFNIDFTGLAVDIIKSDGTRNTIEYDKKDPEYQISINIDNEPIGFQTVGDYEVRIYVGGMLDTFNLTFRKLDYSTVASEITELDTFVSADKVADKRFYWKYTPEYSGNYIFNFSEDAVKPKPSQITVLDDENNQSQNIYSNNSPGTYMQAGKTYYLWCDDYASERSLSLTTPEQLSVGTEKNLDYAQSKGMFEFVPENDNIYTFEYKVNNVPSMYFYESGINSIGTDTEVMNVSFDSSNEEDSYTISRAAFLKKGVRYGIKLHNNISSGEPDTDKIEYSVNIKTASDVGELTDGSAFTTDSLSCETKFYKITVPEGEGDLYSIQTDSDNSIVNDMFMYDNKGENIHTYTERTEDEEAYGYHQTVTYPLEENKTCYVRLTALRDESYNVKLSVNKIDSGYIANGDTVQVSWGESVKKFYKPETDGIYEIASIAADDYVYVDVSECGYGGNFVMEDCTKDYLETVSGNYVCTRKVYARLKAGKSYLLSLSSNHGSTATMYFNPSKTLSIDGTACSGTDLKGYRFYHLSVPKNESGFYKLKYECRNEDASIKLYNDVMQSIPLCSPVKMIFYGYYNINACYLEGGKDYYVAVSNDNVSATDSMSINKLSGELTLDEGHGEREGQIDEGFTYYTVDIPEGEGGYYRISSQLKASETTDNQIVDIYTEDGKQVNATHMDNTSCKDGYCSLNEYKVYLEGGKSYNVLAKLVITDWNYSQYDSLIDLELIKRCTDAGYESFSYVTGDSTYSMQYTPKQSGYYSIMSKLIDGTGFADLRVYNNEGQLLNGAVQKKIVSTSLTNSDNYYCSSVYLDENKTYQLECECHNSNLKCCILIQRVVITDDNDAGNPFVPDDFKLPCGGYEYTPAVSGMYTFHTEETDHYADIFRLVSSENGSVDYSEYRYLDGENRCYEITAWLNGGEHYMLGVGGNDFVLSIRKNVSQGNPVASVVTGTVNNTVRWYKLEVPAGEGGYYDVLCDVAKDNGAFDFVYISDENGKKIELKPGYSREEIDNYYYHTKANVYLNGGSSYNLLVYNPEVNGEADNIQLTKSYTPVSIAYVPDSMKTVNYYSKIDDRVDYSGATFKVRYISGEEEEIEYGKKSTLTGYSFGLTDNIVTEYGALKDGDYEAQISYMGVETTLPVRVSSYVEMPETEIGSEVITTCAREQLYKIVPETSGIYILDIRHETESDWYLGNMDIMDSALNNCIYTIWDDSYVCLNSAGNREAYCFKGYVLSAGQTYFMRLNANSGVTEKCTMRLIQSTKITTDKAYSWNKKHGASIYSFTPEQDGEYQFSHDLTAKDNYLSDGDYHAVNIRDKDGNFISGMENTSQKQVGDNYLYTLTNDCTLEAGKTYYVNVQNKRGLQEDVVTSALTVKKKKVIESISIEESPRTVYCREIDSCISLDNLSVKIVYSDGSEETADYNNNTSSFSIDYGENLYDDEMLLIKGTHVINITYKKQTVPLNIEVKNASEFNTSEFDDNNNLNRQSHVIGSSSVKSIDTFIPKEQGFYSITFTSASDIYINKIYDLTAGNSFEMNVNHEYTSGSNVSTTSFYLEKDHTYCLQYYAYSEADLTLDITYDESKRVLPLTPCTDQGVNLVNSGDQQWYSFTPSETCMYHMMSYGNSWSEVSIQLRENITGDDIYTYIRNEYIDGRSYVYLDSDLEAGKTYYYCLTKNIYNVDSDIRMSFTKDMEATALDVVNSGDKIVISNLKSVGENFGKLRFDVTYTDNSHEILRYDTEGIMNRRITANTSVISFTPDGKMTPGTYDVDFTYGDLNVAKTVEVLSYEDLELIGDSDIDIDGESNVYLLYEPAETGYYRFAAAADLGYVKPYVYTEAMESITPELTDQGYWTNKYTEQSVYQLESGKSYIVRLDNTAEEDQSASCTVEMVTIPESINIHKKSRLNYYKDIDQDYETDGLEVELVYPESTMYANEILKPGDKSIHSGMGFNTSISGSDNDRIVKIYYMGIETQYGVTYHDFDDSNMLVQDTRNSRDNSYLYMGNTYEYDYSYFEPEETGYYKLNVSSEDGSAFIHEMRNSSGTEIYSITGNENNDSALLYMLAGQKYYFICGIKDDDANPVNGSYDLNITSLTDLSKTRVNGRLDERNDESYYQFTAAADSSYLFEVVSDESLNFVICNSNGTEIDLDTFNNASGNRCFYAPLAVGSSYLIKCTNHGEGVNAYSVSASRKKRIEDISIDEEPDISTYYQNMDEGLNYEGLAISINYTDGTSEIVAYGDNSSWGIPFSVSRPQLALGENYITCSFVGNEVQFTVELEEFDTESLEEVTAGTWTTPDRDYMYSGGNNYYVFTPDYEDEENHYFRFYSKGNTDTVGYIYEYDEPDNVLMMNDNKSATDSNFSVKCELESGKSYILRIKRKSEGDGDYRFRITDASLGNEVVSISVDKTDILLDAVGASDTVQITLTGFDTDTEITNRGCTYTVENTGENVVNVNGNGSLTAETTTDSNGNVVATAELEVQALRSGICYLKVEAEDGGYEASVRIAVDTQAPEISDITPNSTTISGVSFGPLVHQIVASAMDDADIDKIYFGYSTTDSDYTYIEETPVASGTGNLSIANADIPMAGFAGKSTVYVDVYATDKCGRESAHLQKIYAYDETAPVVNNFSGNQTDTGTAKLTFSCSGSDVKYFNIYRKEQNQADDSYALLNRLRYHSNSSDYEFIDNTLPNTNGAYDYKLVAVDKVGNEAEETSHVSVIRHNEPPKPVMAIMEGNVPVSSRNVLKADTEYTFDFTGSQDDVEVQSYTLNFGDGPIATEGPLEQLISHTYSLEEGESKKNITITLTVEDNEGETTTETYDITIIDPDEASYLKVKVVDEDGYPLEDAPVYHNLGEANQTIEYTNQDGYVEYFDLPGLYAIGSYADGYMPVSANVLLEAGDIAEETLTLRQGSAAEGKLESHKMTYSEILEAGIDVEAADNNHIIRYEVTLEYEKIDFYYNENTGTYLDDGYAVGGSGGCGYSIKHISDDVTVVLRIPVTVSILKEFYEVDLFIFNNSGDGFRLTDNQVKLNVADSEGLQTDGLTLVKTSDSCEKMTEEIAEVPAGSVQTVKWILRGDKSGIYKLSADYSSNLTYGSQVIGGIACTFEGEDDIRVYGVDNLKVTMQVPESIPVKAGQDIAFYYNLIMENTGSTDDEDMFLPNIEGEGDNLLTRYISTEGTADVDEMPIVLKAQEKILRMYEITDQFEEQLKKFDKYSDFLLYFKSSYVKELTKYGVALNVVTCDWDDLIECRDSMKAQVPVIAQTQPVDVEYGYAVTDATLSVSAAVSDSALKIVDADGEIKSIPDTCNNYELSYIWYDSEMNVVQAESQAEDANIYNVPAGLPVGVYTYYVVARATRSDNEDSAQTQYIPVTLTVDEKEVELEWSGFDDLVYDGEKKAVTATVSDGLVPGDICTVEVIGGDAVNAGDHLATAVSLSNANYVLPQDGVTKTYNIAPKTAILDWSGYETRTYDGTDSSVIATVSNLVDGDSCTVAISGGALAAAGTHAATASALTCTDYKLPDDVKNLAHEYVIDKAKLTVTYVDENIYYNTKPALKVELDGFVGEEREAELVQSGALIPPTVVYKETFPEGNYTLTPSGGSADNYYYEYKSGSLAVKRRDAVVNAQYTVTEPLVNGWINADPGKIEVKPCEGYLIAEGKTPELTSYTNNAIIKNNETTVGHIDFCIMNTSTSEIFICSSVDYKLDKKEPSIRERCVERDTDGKLKLFIDTVDDVSGVKDISVKYTTVNGVEKKLAVDWEINEIQVAEGHADIEGAGKYTIVVTDTAGNILEEEAANAYLVSYESAGGDSCASEIFVPGVALAELPTPVREGYIFRGWYNTADEIINDGVIFNQTSNVTLHAVWEAIPATRPDVTSGVTNSTYGDDKSKLTINATASTDTQYTLSYSWYSINEAGEYTLLGETIVPEYEIINGKPHGDYNYYCSVTATRNDNQESAVSDKVLSKLVVNKRTIELQWNDDLTYTGKPQSVEPQITNLLNKDTCEIVLSDNVATDAGNYTATLDSLSNDNYQLPDDCTKSYTIKQAQLTVSCADDVSAYYGTTPDINLDVTGFVNEESTETAKEYVAPTLGDIPTAVGHYTLTPQGGSAANYKFTYESFDLDIVTRDAAEGVNGQYTINADKVGQKYSLPIVITPNEGYEVGYTETAASTDALTVTDSTHNGFYVKNTATGEIYNAISLTDLIYVAPTATPVPTKEPTKAPTQTPAPTKIPVDKATATPVSTKEPVAEPTKAPTKEPTKAPTKEPTKAPAKEPTEAPTKEPTEAPTKEPTEAPTKEPTEAPTQEPTKAPTQVPTQAPLPTQPPVVQPTTAPMQQPQVYTISYVLNKGTNAKENVSTYTAAAEVKLKEATRKGYLFKGWFTDDGCKNKIDSITAGTTGNMTLYADWTKCKPKVQLKSIKRKAGSIIVTFKKGSDIDGYQIKYSTSKKFKASKTKTKNTGAVGKFTIKKASSLKYYFKIMAYVKDSAGNKVYSKAVSKSVR